MKYFIWTLGCAMNKSDAERIVSVLCNSGFTETKKESEADIIVTFACSVRQSAINRIYGKIKEWQDIRSERPLTTILSGCVLKEDRIKMKKYFDLIFDINEISKFTDFLPSVIPNPDPESIKKVIDSGQARMTPDGGFFQIHPKYESNFQAYVPISTGCDNFCTYCAVPYTRGREISRPMNEILAEIQELVKNGYKEITLLGQNVNSYGNDLKNSTNFTELLKKIDEIEGTYRVYFYSNHPKDMSDELIKTLPKLQHFPHYIHLPLQSGSDKILKKMNRHYTQKQYLELVDKIKKNIPEVAITTDIIVGFPGEAEEDFNQTKEVMEKVGFSMPFIAKYSPRPGTATAKLKDDVSKTEKGKRWRELTDIQKEILNRENKKLVGRNLMVLIDSEKKGKYYGRTDNYKVVEIPKKQTDLLGRFVNVEIVSSEAWILKAN
jgi:tRNA-2-methylthio-N6-dimethylallyladenosine synthase